MMFEFRNGKAEMDVTDCAKNVLEEFPIKFKEMTKNITPAGVDSFGEDLSKKSSEEMKKVFHRTVAQGSFACKQLQPDIQPMTAVPCARVKSPEQKDWNKSVQMMKFS